MKRALTIAAALAHRPPLLFLDEPTTGLDVISARNSRRMIAALRDEGVTVFLTTHYLEEAEQLCDRIAIIVQGRIVALDTVDGLKALAQSNVVVEATVADPNGNIRTMRFYGKDVVATVQLALTQSKDRHILAISTVRPTLEDVFVQLTGLSAEVIVVEKGGKGQSNVAG
nr:ABC transporter ATP-binding protein [Chloroflexota bacterium]